MEDIQKDIAEFFNGLTPKEQEEWWTEGDYVFYDGNTYLICDISDHSGEFWIDYYDPDRNIEIDWLKPETCIPAPCSQFWWKLMVKHIGICKALENLNEAPIISYSGPEGTAHYHDDEEATKTKRVLLRVAINMQKINNEC